MGVQMIVKKAFRPGGSGSAELKPGSLFVADGEQQAKLCRAMGWCSDAPAVVAPLVVAEEPPKRTYTRKVVEAEEAQAPAAKKTPRAYHRRDLRAEE